MANGPQDAIPPHYLRIDSIPPTPYTPKMSVPDEPIALGLNAQPPTGSAPPAEALQFRRAEPVGTASTQRCFACQGPVSQTYYHASGRVVCPACAMRIQHGQQAPPVYSFPRALLFGAGAGLAGCAIYATVAIATGMEIGLIAILVGVMVGKAIRRASGGFGGRPQQILAVVLTYFSITTSYIPVIIWEVAHKSKMELARTGKGGPASNRAPASARPTSAARVIVYLLAVCAAAPFLSLTSGLSGLISLFIIFIGLKQAWSLTGRSEILVMGPYQAEGGSA